jgi:type IV secretory pathway TrbL component
MKFAKHYLESIDGIEIYPIIALIIFFSFFVLLLWNVLSLSKSKIKELSELPLESTSKDELL